MKYTTLAIIGRPNVGKSSLFNVLTASRQAIVDDQAGVTVDRHYGYVNFNGHQFIIVDTGGYTDESQQPLQSMLNEQVIQAIDESDILLHVVDAKEGITALDHAIADKVRKMNKTVIVVANKAENIDELTAKQDFYTIAKYIVPISAAHKKGIDTLRSQICDFIDCTPATETIDILPSLAIIGRPNAGKSTLTNEILGRKQVLVSDIPGTTRDSIYLDFIYKDKIYRLIDTAGLRRKSRISAASIERYSVLRSMKAIVDSDVVVLMIDAALEISEQDCRLFNHVQSIGRPLIIVLNKWDLLDSYDRERIKSKLDFRLRQVNSKDVITCTAATGYGVSRILDLFIKKYELAKKEISTGKINTILKKIVEEHPPALKNGKRPKLTYAHIAGYKPHKIVIHGKKLDYISDDYKRYLHACFQKHLDLGNTPVKILFKNSDK